MTKTTNQCRCHDGPHDTFGACLRAKNFKIGYCQSARGLDRSSQNRWDSELDLYRSARKQGVQPRSTHARDIRSALDLSDKTGVAFRAA